MNFVFVMLLNLIARLPLILIQAVGATLGWALYLCAPRYARQLRNHLAASGVLKNTGDCNPFAWRCAAHTGMGALELLIAWGRTPKAIARLIRHCEGWEAVERSLALGHGLLFVTPHVGSYDIAGRYLATRLPFPLTALYRPPKLRWLEPLMNAGRQRGNARTAPASTAGVRSVMKALKHGEATIVLPDQVPGQGDGEWAPFFGRPAYTMTLVPRLASLRQVDTYFFCSRRLGLGRGFEVMIRPLQQPFSGERVQDAAQLNQEIEALIRLAPEQYLWSYNRYKVPAGVTMPSDIGVS